MQPYQRASQTIQDKRDKDLGTLKKAGKMGLQAAGALVGAPLISKALPFLAEGVTAEKAIAGLTALNPSFGKFINNSLKQGSPFNEIKNFLGEKLVEAEASAPKSLFEKIRGDVDVESLGEGIKKQLQLLAPIANKLESSGKDEKDPAVKKLMKKIRKILGGKQGFLEKQAMEADLGSIAERMAPMVQQPGAQMQQPMPDQMGQQPQQGQPQPGQGQQALMAILQKIQASRGPGG